MRVVLADLKGLRGFVSKDTVAAGYGSRLQPFTRVTQVICTLKRRLHDPPSVQLAYLAAIAADAGHEVIFTTTDEVINGDVAIILSSLVDYRHEAAWADDMRAHGVRVGFVGLAASKMPELFADHADFLITGEPEEAFSRLMQGERLSGTVASKEIDDLDVLPFPRWDLLASGLRRTRGVPGSVRPLHGGFPLLASRSCPEFCTYCPHRILSTYRVRSVRSIADELEHLCSEYDSPYVIFRDPLFSQDRDRVLALCDIIEARGLTLRFECETRLDRLDTDLLDRMHAAGLRAMSFGVESLSPSTLKKAGRRPIPPAHQRAIVDHCRHLGIVTAAFYVLGFLEDDWASIGATIDYAAALGSTLAQFKMLTPYPGTPLWKQMAPRVFETDWQKFDGFTPTFNHPSLTTAELHFLLGAAYTRFYMRPSWLENYLGVRSSRVRHWISKLDDRVSRRHAREEIAAMSRAVVC
jgi:anaerobic magnesium-protoporphyrin IX monomethyl ester cyclase